MGAGVRLNLANVLLVTGARSHQSVLLGQREVDNKVDFLMICLSEISHFSMKILVIFCGLWRWGPIFRSVTMEIKNGSEAVVHVHFPHWK